MRAQQEQESGFVRSEKRSKGKVRFNHRRASQQLRTGTYKSWEEREEEQQAARRRWAGTPPLTMAREMIAEANLQETVLVDLMAAISRMSGPELESFVASGKLAEVLEEATVSD